MRCDIIISIISAGRILLICMLSRDTMRGILYTTTS